MKISKLFHWLYAILMFLPFGLLVYNGLASMWSGNVINFQTWYQSIDLDFIDIGASEVILEVYMYLLLNVFGFDGGTFLFSTICNILTYWTCVSIIWLVFDVLMYVPLLVHRWIDKAKIE